MSAKALTQLEQYIERRGGHFPASRRTAQEVQCRFEQKTGITFGWKKVRAAIKRVCGGESKAKIKAEHQAPLFMAPAFMPPNGGR